MKRNLSVSQLHSSYFVLIIALCFILSPLATKIYALDLIPSLHSQDMEPTQSPRLNDRTALNLCIVNTGRTNANICSPSPTGSSAPNPTSSEPIPTSTLKPTPTLRTVPTIVPIHWSLPAQFQKATATPTPIFFQEGAEPVPTHALGYGNVNINSTLKACETGETIPFQVTFEICDTNNASDPVIFSLMNSNPGCVDLNTDSQGFGEVLLPEGTYEVKSPLINCSGTLNCSQPIDLRDHAFHYLYSYLNPDYYWTIKPKTFTVHEGDDISINAKANDLQCKLSAFHMDSRSD